MATWEMLRTVAVDPDLALRQAAITRVLDLRDAYGDFVPRDALREGFIFRGERVSFSSFQKGIHRARQMRGPAALSLFTTPPKEGRAAPYADEVDVESGLIIYHYRAQHRAGG
jgi:putative restriction endonuclease